MHKHSLSHSCTNVNFPNVFPFAWLLCDSKGAKLAPEPQKKAEIKAEIKGKIKEEEEEEEEEEGGEV